MKVISDKYKSKLPPKSKQTIGNSKNNLINVKIELNKFKYNFRCMETV